MFSAWARQASSTSSANRNSAAAFTTRACSPSPALCAIGSDRINLVIPASNVRHLILRADVVQAVADGKFHIYPVKTIDEGIAILTGISADGMAENYVNKAVADRLKELALGLKEFAGSEKNGATEMKQ